MIELSLEYMNKIVSQIQYTSTLLDGFYLTVLV